MKKLVLKSTADFTLFSASMILFALNKMLRFSFAEYNFSLAASYIGFGTEIVGLPLAAFCFGSFLPEYVRLINIGRGKKTAAGGGADKTLMILMCSVAVIMFFVRYIFIARWWTTAIIFVCGFVSRFLFTRNIKE